MRTDPPPLTPITDHCGALDAIATGSTRDGHLGHSRVRDMAVVPFVPLAHCVMVTTEVLIGADDQVVAVEFQVHCNPS